MAFVVLLNSSMLMSLLTLNQGVIHNPYLTLVFSIIDHLKINFVIHVDDFAIASSDPTLTKSLVDHLQTKYTIEESTFLEHFSGTHVHYSYENGIKFMNLSQPRQLQKIFNNFGITDDTIKAPTTPMQTTFDLQNLLLLSEQSQSDSPRVDITKYRKALGLLIFILRTRPDVAFAINSLACQTTNCTDNDYTALKRVARYLHGTRHKTLRYRCNSITEAKNIITLQAWCDASHANRKG